jgi:type IX secretion system PorP/SprF family membrane protein
LKIKTKIMKKLLILIAITCSSLTYGQQQGLSSQYLFNEAMINPGALGGKAYVPIQFNYRKQWIQFPGSPTSQYISAHGAIAKNMGIGGSIFNDVSGPSRRSGINFGASYKLRLDKANNHKLGLGINLSMTQHIIDPTKLTTYLPNDPSVERGFNNVFVPDATFGAFYTFKDRGFAGISASNLVQMDRDLYDFNNLLYNPLVRTYYVMGGYKFKLSKKFDLKLSTLGQVIETGTWQADATAILIFNNQFWLGGSYRHTDAVVMMAGMQFGVFKIGYSYDYTLSDISTYSVGTHELLLELQIFRSNKDGNSRTPWMKRNRIYTPSL